jgi:hypothetical protein
LNYDLGVAQGPVWRSAFNAVEQVVSPRIEWLVKSEGFAVAVGLAQTVQRDMVRRSERISRRAWHLLNLPAGSDVNRLLAQMGSVQRQVRELEKRVEDAAQGWPEEVILGGPPGRPDGGSRAHPS